MILPAERDPRFIRLHRGGSMTDETHHALALWAASCAEHVVEHFEAHDPDDRQPRQALALIRAWTRGHATMRECHAQAILVNRAGREAPPAARFAALAVGQAVAVAHVAAHELGAAAYALRAARHAAPSGREEQAMQRERQWQWDQLPPLIRGLVVDDQRLRNAICWNVFLADEPCPRKA